MSDPKFRCLTCKETFNTEGDCPICGSDDVDLAAPVPGSKNGGEAYMSKSEQEVKDSVRKGKSHQGANGVLATPRSPFQPGGIGEAGFRDPATRELIIVMDAADHNDFRVKEAASSGCNNCNLLGLGFDPETEELVCPACGWSRKPEVDKGGFEKPKPPTERVKQPTKAEIKEKMIQDIAEALQAGYGSGVDDLSVVVIKHLIDGGVSVTDEKVETLKEMLVEDGYAVAASV